MLLLVVTVLLACAVSATCSLLEAVLLSLTPIQVADLSTRHPRTGAIWTAFKTNVEKPIAAILILNTTSHTVGAAVGGAQCGKVFGEDSLWIFSVVFTFVMLQYTEILPKTVGVAWNRPLAIFIGKPLYYGVRVLEPLIWLTHVLNRPFERRPGAGAPSKTVEEITALAGMAQLAREINRQQARIIRDTPKLSRLSLGQVMIPAERVVCLPADLSRREAAQVAAAHAHTRYPVSESGEPDVILGYVNLKEIVQDVFGGEGGKPLRDLLRPVHFLPPEAKAADLLRRFVDEKVRLAIIRDAVGRILGLVTLEDIIEELVGELEDAVPAEEELAELPAP
jgi:CBS domain containing-hemolysin-like protein